MPLSINDMTRYKHGFQLEWLPPYSPDLNSIEPKWAEVKAIRRRERCSIDELFMEHVKYV
ncbi:transposase [Photorhabdus akhurstii]|uniref:transposase n=1 Tax=Photorhabdus akhurstii TaxID=171438 RepID=UPI0037044983